MNFLGIIVNYFLYVNIWMLFLIVVKDIIDIFFFNNIMIFY